MDSGEESIDVERPDSQDVAALAVKARVESVLFGKVEAPATIGDYEVIGSLGAGGMGLVHAAWDESLGRRVAIKVLPAEAVGDTRERARLFREAQALAKVSHPNVVQVYEVGEHEGGVFVAMELVEGKSLRQWQTAGQHTHTELLEVYAQAGHGLAAAHRAGLVHRDFKPSNVLVGDDGRVRVVDFGLALGPGLHGSSTSPAGGRLDAPPESVTRTGTVAGTPAYMAPEQLAGESADARADQFSFCVSLYEALVGTRPFELSVLRKTREGPLPEPAQGSRSLPWSLRPALRKGMAREPSRRWPDMDALLAALGARAVWRRRLWTWTGPVVLGAAVIGIGIAGGGSRSCEIPSDAPSVKWRDRAPAVFEALDATGVPYIDAAKRTVQEGVDRFVRDWDDVHAKACEEVSELRSMAISRCLGHIDIDFDAVVSELERSTPESILNVESIVVGLPAPMECLEAASESSIDRVAPTRAQSEILARARTDHNAGHYDEALAGVESLLADPSFDRSAVLADVLELQGRTLVRLERADEAHRALARAKAEATAGAEVRARASLVALEQAIEGERWEVARYLVSEVDEAIAVAGRRPSLQARLLDLRGRLSLYGDQEPDAAVQWHARALEVWTSSGPLGSGRTNSKVWLADAKAEAGEAAEAKVLYVQALEERNKTVGPQHPDYAAVVFNLGLLAFEAGELDQARAQFAEALEVERAALGVDSTMAARTEVVLSQTLAMLGETDEALARAKSAWKVHEEHAPDRHSDRKAALRWLASLEMNLDLHRDSLAHHLEFAEEFGPTSDVAVAQNIAMLLRKTDDCRGALEWVPRAREAINVERTRDERDREYDDETLAVLALFIDEKEALGRDACGEPGALEILERVISQSEELRADTGFAAVTGHLDALLEEARAEAKRIHEQSE